MHKGVRPRKNSEPLIEFSNAAEYFVAAIDSIVIPPIDWPLGALLNVRNGGDTYRVTLHPEEYDQRHPERCLQFSNPALCQDFVSQWYSRQHHDPRAR